MNYPSIFNDVLGPVMRGPSSSHSAAALRIGRLCRDLMDGNIKDVLIEYDPNGSLVTTHTSQGTDMGLYGGFLGWDADDERLPDYQLHIAQSKIDVNVDYLSYGATHPNTYRLTLSNEKATHQVRALSTGGGIIEVIEIDEAPVSIRGDYHELLIYVNAPSKTLLSWLDKEFDFDQVGFCKSTKQSFINVKSYLPFQEDFLAEIENHTECKYLRLLSPILPVLSKKEVDLPFLNCEQMMEFNEGKKLELWQLALEYEKARSGHSEDELMQMMKSICNTMQRAINRGLEGTEYEDRLLPAQSVGFNEKLGQNGLIESGVMNQMILQVSAMMEAKSAMVPIVAAPTAGSCGSLPGAVFGYAKVYDNHEDAIHKAMFVAGIVGVFIASGATFAAEEAGCMAECGSGSSMAAAALVALAGGTPENSIGAASMALQNSLGMVCDPIASRVEAPCLGKNVLAATNALSCANMALSDYQHLIPMDEVIAAMASVGKAMPRELRCTALGGLAATPTAKRLEKEMAGKSINESTRHFKSC